MAMDWSGVGNIMVTPFADDEQIDVESLEKVTRWAIDAGSSFVVPLGIMGEAHKLTERERVSVTEHVVAAAQGEVPVVPGCTAESTFAALARIEDAVGAGASAVMIAPPRSATAPALQIQHYLELADRASVPIVVQDEPVTTGVKMSAATIGEIGRHENIAAIKVEEVPSPTKVSGILAANPDIPCFGGLGGLYFLEELDRGATGIMTGFGYPEILVQIYQAYAAGDREAARTIFFDKMPLIRYEAQLGVGGVSIRKTLLKKRGVIATDTVRAPIGAGDPRALGELSDMIDFLGLSPVQDVTA